MTKYKKNILIILLIFCAVFVGIKGISYAKYAYNSLWNHYLKTKGFYFASDKLTVNGLNNVNNAWTGENIYFNVKNSRNDSLITDYDISYLVSCEVLNNPNYSCKINNQASSLNGVLSSHESCVNSINDGVNVSSLSKTDCELGGYEWIKQSTETNLYFNIFDSNGNGIAPNDIRVKITAQSLNPYSERLFGNFTLHKASSPVADATMNYNKHGNYGNLVVSNGISQNKCLKLNWDSSKLRIDIDKNSVSSYSVDNNDYIKEIKFNLNSNSTINYIFYGIPITNEYSVSDFELSESSGC